MKFHLVDTDNFGGDYPDEKYLKDGSIKLNFYYATTRDADEAEYWYDRAEAQAAADAVNEHWGADSPRYLKVVDEAYALQPGFEP